MKIVEKRVDELIPYANNPRDNERAVEAVASSIREFGFKVPVVIDKNNIIVAGHTRVLASKEIGLEKVPCIVADDLTDEQIKAFRLADNKTAELAEWDFSKLEQELAELSNIDMEQFGFDEMIEPEVTEPNDDPEEIAEQITVPKTQLGDIYQLGEHRLICGDSTDAKVMMKLMNGERADMVFTDPPYGVSIGDKNKTLNSVQPSGRCTENIENDTLDSEELYKILVRAFTNLRENGAAEHCSYYVSSPQGGELGLMMMMKDSGLPVRHMLIWVKNSATFSLGRLDYDYRHEPIFYTWDKKHIFYGGYNTTVIDDTTVIDKMNKKQLVDLCKKLMFPKEDSVIYEDKPRKCDLHPTMKPIKLVARLITNSSKRDDIVADIFGGSGTTLLACEQLGRKCRMIELDPKYCDVIVKRWEDMTGRKATLLTR